MGQTDCRGIWILFWWAGPCSVNLVSSFLLWVGLCSLSVVWPEANCGRGNGSNGSLLQKDLCLHCCIQCPWPCSRPLSTHASSGDFWTLTAKSGSVSGGITAPFSWVLVLTRFCLCPPSVSFPSPVEVLLSNPTGLQSQIPRGFSVRLPDPQVGKSVVGPWTFLTVQDFLWCNSSAVCGSAWWLYGGAMVTSSKRTHASCRVICSQVCCSQSPCLCGRPLLTRTSQETLKHSKVVWPSLWGLWDWCTRGFVWAL